MSAPQYEIIRKLTNQIVGLETKQSLVNNGKVLPYNTSYCTFRNRFDKVTVEGRVPDLDSKNQIGATEPLIRIY